MQQPGDSVYRPRKYQRIMLVGSDASAVKGSPGRIENVTALQYASQYTAYANDVVVKAVDKNLGTLYRGLQYFVFPGMDS